MKVRITADRLGAADEPWSRTFTTTVEQDAIGYYHCPATEESWHILRVQLDTDRWVYVPAMEHQFVRM